MVTVITCISEWYIQLAMIGL